MDIKKFESWGELTFFILKNRYICTEIILQKWSSLKVETKLFVTIFKTNQGAYLSGKFVVLLGLVGLG